ncbi:MAG: tRNA (cytidine(34)-2'-O)-methyltransferase [Bowdeniella nasicola]|nr:tRNA (cytidine(34)-2'-O)-methyltransferase [Bowdeniella nasicola]
MFHLVFHEPRIPGNTGAAIRLAACTGARLHLIEPLGFDFSDAHLKRAGLDYHDLAVMDIHADLDAFFAAIAPERIWAFSGHSNTHYHAIDYRDGDALLFGCEPTGLPEAVLADPRLTGTVRIPMQPGLRSLNLANSASIAIYEAWRQNGFAGGV